VQLTIDTSSREEAELIAALLPQPAEARSIRGYGLVTVPFRTAAERQQILEAVQAGAAEHNVSWLRVRWGDEERVFRQGQPAYQGF
jgi:hypothetical protein